MLGQLLSLCQTYCKGKLTLIKVHECWTRHDGYGGVQLHCVLLFKYLLCNSEFLKSNFCQVNASQLMSLKM